MPGLKAAVVKWLRDTVWPGRTPFGRAMAAALQPAATAYGCTIGLRNFAYDWQLFRSRRAEIPVVSVGNLAVGGTGKTPLTVWLASRLREHGLDVAIVSRGYGGAAREPVVVSRGRGPEVNAEHAGDEAVMMARRFAGAVIVARRRAAGVELARSLGCHVAVLDDGFQHRSLARDFDLLLLGGRTGALLPAGPMREPYRSVRRADALALVDKGGGARPLGPPASAMGKPLFWVRMVPECWVESEGGQWRELPLQDLSGQRVAVVSSIADPSSLYGLLQQWEVQVAESFEFPDHHRYTTQDWQWLNRRTQNFEHIVTTEKDLVKLEHFPFARGKLRALRIGPQVEKANDLLQLVVAAVHNRGLHRVKRD